MDKRIMTLIMLLVAIAMGTKVMAANEEAYAVFTSGNSTLTFYYDDQKNGREGDKYSLNTGENTPGWIDDGKQFEKVVFAKSFASYRPTTTSKWFSGQAGLKTITNIKNLKTDNVGNMLEMFRNCSILEEVDVSGFNTSRVRSMACMFEGCVSLKSLDVRGWDTSQVFTMYYSFYNCKSLTELDVSRWDTSNVVVTKGMFFNCESLTNLDVSRWDTSKVTDMWRMFDGCRSLTELDVSGWDTSKVTNMQALFYSCTSLTNLDVSKWDTSNVTNMRSIFNGCSSLTSLDVSKWDTSNVTNMDGMFIECSSLKSLDVSKWDTSNVTYMGSMFYGCSSLTSLDVSNWNTSNVTFMGSMFYGCSSLTSLDVSNWNTSNVTYTAQMFYGCKNLTSLDLSSWDTSNVERMMYMFKGCQALTTIYAGPTWTVGTEIMKSIDMFTHCENLRGSAGTNYDSNHVNGSYAHIDGGPSNPGYLSERIYNLWVGGTRVTSTNSQSLPSTTGSVTYDGAKKTLTLNGATITVTGQSTHAISNGDPWEHSVDGIDGLTIEVIGNCQLKAQSIGLLVNGNTTLTGTGQLNVNAGEEGVWIQGKNFTSKVKRLAVTAVREAVKGTGFGVMTIDASTFEAVSSTPDLYHPIRNLFRMNLTDSRYADPGGAWKYADANKYYYDEDRGFMIFGDEDYRGKVLIEPAAAPVNYRLWVGGTRVTSENKNAIGVASGTASYDPATQTLTLNNANIVAEGYDDGISNGLPNLEGMADFKIVCKGTNNSIDAVNSDGYGLALYGNTTITGSRLGIKAYDKGFYLEDFKELNLLNSNVCVEAGYPVYCGYNTFVYVRNSRLKADPGLSQNSPVEGAREFDLINSEYQDPDIGINPDLLSYNETAQKMYYNGNIYDGPILIVPTGVSIATGLKAMGNGQLTMDNSLPLYNLHGQRVSHPVKGQIYIQNGRKVKF
ncbi:MAG: BspA family leucine-rich repeat surface protein [Prevotella sp.]|nr:BspA family leucine-rich repeat surface protein [Prevotella sp.]